MAPIEPSTPAGIVLEPDALDRIRELQGPHETDLLTEMIDAFLSSAPAHLAQMTDALAQADADKLANAAHSLKSGAAYLGAAEVRQLCLELEARGRSGETTGGQVLVGALHAAFEKTRVALLAEIAAPRAA